jgi:hypothetical protein
MQQDGITTMTVRESVPNGPKDAHDFLALFQQLMPQLWTMQHNHGTRSLRTLLDAAERLQSHADRSDEVYQDCKRR